MVDAAAGIPHLPSVGLVAPWLQNQSILETVYGGPEGIAGLMQVAAEAEATGIQNTVKGIAIAANAQDRFSGIDVLVNNAGYGIVGAVEETPQAELRALMKPNFFGAVTVTQAALPLIRKRRNGAIVMISSLGGPLPFWRFGTSLTSKFARDGRTEALAQEIALFGLKAMIVEPGELRTDFADSALRHMPRMDEYDAIFGGTREFAKGTNGTQAGDPVKAAAAIEMSLKSDTRPLRLALGDDAVGAIRDHSEALLAELSNWEAVARSVTYPKAAQTAA